MDAVKERFTWPKDDSFEAAGAALTALEAQRRHPLTNRELAEHHKDFRRAMAPWTKMLIDLTYMYSRPMVLQMKKPGSTEAEPGSL
jgi:anti-sigma-K factor RskA